jgi:hypothetical protein
MIDDQSLHEEHQGSVGCLAYINQLQGNYTQKPIFVR